MNDKLSCDTKSYIQSLKLTKPVCCLIWHVGLHPKHLNGKVVETIWFS